MHDLAETIQDAQAKTGREVSLKIYRLQEIAKRLSAREHFVLSVLSKPKLFIVGTQRELDQIAGRESSDCGADE